MDKFFTVGQTAKLSGLSAETLRHYDRINLVKPNLKDRYTGYRYYDEDDIIKLKTVALMKKMDLPLDEIARVLSLTSLEDVVKSLTRAKESAFAKIEETYKAIAQVEKARASYQSLISIDHTSENAEVFEVEKTEERVLLTSCPSTPKISNLWQYHNLFYGELRASEKELFKFDDSAYLFFDIMKRESRLYAVCKSYNQDNTNIKILPGGKYLCIRSDQDGYENALNKLKLIFEEKKLLFPHWIVTKINIIGLLKWNYILQAKM